MLDPKLLREHFSTVKAGLEKRGFALDEENWLRLETTRKTLQVSVETLQNERNQQSKQIGLAKSRGEDVQAILDTMKGFSDALEAQRKELDALLEEQYAFLAAIPNIPHVSVPVGLDEEANQEIYTWGDKPAFDYAIQDHVALGEITGMIDFEGARKLSGSRFGVLKSEIALMHRALGQFMLDVHTREHGYTECYVPYLVEPHCLFGTGQLPKFDAECFKIDDERHFRLIPTAEVPLTNLVRDSLLELQDLPLKLTAHTPCFRSEAGAYGKDMRGMFRQHQFDKVELVQIVAPEKSYEALESLCGHSEAILQKLQLPYRKLILCSGDMSFYATKTYDLEVWLPGQARYREIASISNCEDFQARRMMARVRLSDKNNEYLHTLNGSGVAVGRCLIAILENYQQRDGTIRVPTVLQPYMGGKTVILERR